ncbi:MAG: T9SS type A sorting domain-containing protein [Candidatus Eisenbacteria bacterium]|nr:T9SS type A sorting domain-containing protein [Candidatus Eisenbacteria bacterium]
MRRILLLTVLAALVAGLAAWPRHLVSRPAVSPDFVHFESAHVHPAVLTPGGGRLLVVNTPDARLSVFDVTGAAPVRIAEIPVGMEPVSVACLDDSTAWVVNQLSDDVSVVDLNLMHARATVRVGDEPADVVFAGTPKRAYVSVSGEDVVKVYDPASVAAPLASIAIPGRMPRALAKTADGSKVYAAVFAGGNRTTVMAGTRFPADSMPADPDLPRDPGLPSPPPRVGLIVQQQNGSWYDMYGTLWSSKVKHTMPDNDVIEITTSSATVTRTFSDVGTINFNLAVSPFDGRLAVVNTQGRDLLRFEPRLIGYLVETQVSFAPPAGPFVARKLDPHIDYATLPGTQAEADSAIGIPTGCAYSGDGQRLYVTSLATNRIAVVNPYGGALSTVKARVPAVAGPTGVVVDDARGRLYVVGRLHNQLQTLSTANFAQLALATIGFDPTPDPVVNGRKFLYGGFTSAHGDQSCATCHVFGDTDLLAWDLGDPLGGFVPPPGPNPNGLHGFDPMKGPTVTQSLRGLTNTEPFHWRGDRANLAAFNGAFATLMGRTTVLADSEMSAFSDFAMALAYPPNPRRYLDGALADAPPGQASAVRGQTFFDTFVMDSTGRRCVDCHGGPAGTNRALVSSTVIGDPQDLKVPHLRALYRNGGFRDSAGAVNARGVAFAHDGTADNLFDFLKAPGLHQASGTDADRRDLEAFLLGFDTGMAPAVGYQLTFDGTNNADATAIARLDTLVGQADASACDLIAKGRSSGQPRGWLYQGAGQWRSDRAAAAAITTAQLRALGGPGTEVTVTGVPKGSGQRMGLDRDRDTYLDGDELDAGSDPGNPASTPLNVSVPVRGSGSNALRWVRPNPTRGTAEVGFTLGRAGKVDVAVLDVMGREVRTLARGLRLEAGVQSLRWDGLTKDGREAGAGVYFLRLKTDGGAWTRPLVRIR